MYIYIYIYIYELLRLSLGFETSPSLSNGLKQLVSHYSLFCSNASLSGFLCQPCYGTKDKGLNGESLAL